MNLLLEQDRGLRGGTTMALVSLNGAGQRGGVVQYFHCSLHQLVLDDGQKQYNKPLYLSCYQLAMKPRLVSYRDLNKSVQNFEFQMCFLAGCSNKHGSSETNWKLPLISDISCMVEKTRLNVWRAFHKDIWH